MRGTDTLISGLTTLSLALAALIPPAAQGAEVVPLAHFNQVSLHEGGHVVLRNGPVQRVTLVEGSTKFSDLTVGADGELVIRACPTWSCPHRYELEVDIVSPDINAVSVLGGGEIEAVGTFANKSSLAAAVAGGGTINLHAMPARSVSASVKGGGDILVNAGTSLSTSIWGGGTVTYWGHPAVSNSIIGGGDVRSAEE